MKVNRLSRLFLTALLTCLSLICAAATTAQTSEEPMIRIWAWSPDGQTVALGMDDGTVQLVDATTLRVVNRFDTGQGSVRAVAWRGDGQVLATGGADGSVKLWALSDRTLLLQLGDHGQPPKEILWSLNQQVIYTATTDPDYSPALRKWDATTGVLLLETDVVAGGLTLSPNGQTLFGVTGIQLSSISPETLEIIDTYRLDQDHEQGYQAIRWSISPHSERLVIGYLNGRVRVWDLVNVSVLHEFNAHPNPSGLCCTVTDSTVAAIYDDGQFVSSITVDGTFRVWDMTGERGISTVNDHPIALRTSFSPYGGRLSVVGGVIPFQILTPAPSLERLSAIAALCARDATTQTRAVTTLAQPITTLDALPAFVAQLDALPDGAIPPACAADLRAVAAALGE
jgi:WD40 repeat protein